MKLFAVRHIKDKQVVGFFFTDFAEELVFFVDEISDPIRCEYKEIEEAAAITWPEIAPAIGVAPDDLESADDRFREGVQFEHAFNDFIYGNVDEGWTEVLPAEDQTQCVYFIKSGDHIKIGFTSGSVKARLAALSTGSPNEFELLCTITGGSLDLEKQIHRRFAKLRGRGEWFKEDPELNGFIFQANAVEISKRAISDDELNDRLPDDGEA